MSETPVLLFAKAPELGRVKTRLIPALGEEGAARLHAEMLRWKAAELAARHGNVQLWVTPSVAHPLFDELSREYALPLFLQSGRDLGERMGRALASALSSAPAAVLLGTDIPPLPGTAVEEAIARLDEYDAVLSPAEDGGFGLIALTAFEAELFDHIPWGSAEVLQGVRSRMRGLGWRWHELPACWDVDRPEDLERLCRYAGTPEAVRRVLEAAGLPVLK